MYIHNLLQCNRLHLVTVTVQIVVQHDTFFRKRYSTTLKILNFFYQRSMCSCTTLYYKTRVHTIKLLILICSNVQYKLI